MIGKKLGSIIKAAADEGHEFGLHAWDHYTWQNRIDSMESETMYSGLARGVDLITDIIGRAPTCSAAPAWKCNDMVLREKARFSFEYNSDCRGTTIFVPVVEGKEFAQPQIPVTLPTYDEVIGSNGITHDTYNDYLLSLVEPEGLNVLTVHAEVEGIACLSLFENFLHKAQAKGFSIVPLGALLKDIPQRYRASLTAEELPGRQGWIAVQKSL